MAARQVIEGREVITVVPVPHIPPSDPEDAVEMLPGNGAVSLRPVRSGISIGVKL